MSFRREPEATPPSHLRERLEMAVRLIERLPEEVVPGWMQGYVSTYLQRDARTLLEVRDETQFASFLALCAALTAQECNFSQLGRDIGLSSVSAKRWLPASTSNPG